MSHLVTLSWVPPASGADGYNVYRGPAGGALVKTNADLIVVDPPTTNPVLYGDVVPVAGSYVYDVTAVKDGIESPHSNQAPADIPAIAPDAPTSLQVVNIA
jgi:hypothetical protein